MDHRGTDFAKDFQEWDQDELFRKFEFEPGSIFCNLTTTTDADDKYKAGANPAVRLLGLFLFEVTFMIVF